jgi:hypothetical protein
MIVVFENCKARLSAMKSIMAEVYPGLPVVGFNEPDRMIDWIEDNALAIGAISLSLEAGPSAEVKGGNSQMSENGEEVVRFLCSVEPVCRVIIHTNDCY